MFPDTFKDVPCVSPQEKAYQLDKTLEQLGYDPHAKPPSKATWALSVVFELGAQRRRLAGRLHQPFRGIRLGLVVPFVP